MSGGDVGLYDAARAATRVDERTWLLDLGFMGRGGVVAAYLLEGGGELALIETGPTSTLENLRAAVRQAGFDPSRIGRVLVTHIHLDHAGAVGPLARANPSLTVRVHPVGAPHMVDPSRLVASAARIYGDRMDELWGEVAPIPAAQVRPLVDGEWLRVAGRELQAVFTPGHASHHVAYWEPASGAAYTGDVGGVRMQGTGYVCPPTPPPDLDTTAWAESAMKLRSLGARRWYPTHFGPFDDAGAHLDQLLPNLDDFVRIGFDALDQGADQEALTALLHAEMARRLGDVPEGVLTNLEWATPSYMAALGLIRLHKKARAQGA